MPELPEVRAVSNWCENNLVGLRVESADLAAISVLKTPFDLSALNGQQLCESKSVGKYLCWRFDDVWVAIHSSRSGWLHVRKQGSDKPTKLTKGPLALRFRFVDGPIVDLTEAGKDKRAAVWFVDQLNEVPQIATLGPEPLSPEFTENVFGALLSSAGGRSLKIVLTDQQTIAGIGNAWSDEILHQAKLSPFKPANKLSETEVANLYSAVCTVLQGATNVLSGLDVEKMKDSKRANLAVHGRDGEECPTCGDVVRSVDRGSSSLQYCANCQTGGKALADRRLSKLLK